jgi:hypothetical protein
MLGLEPSEAYGAGFYGGIAWMAEFRIDIVYCEWISFVVKRSMGTGSIDGAYRATCIALKNSSQIILDS